MNPIREGDYGKWKYGGDTIGFIFGVHRNIMFPPDYCPEVGLTHWQPRLDANPPSPQFVTPPVVSSSSRERPKRRYRITPEGRAAKQEKMREYWRKKKGDATTAGENGRRTR